MLFRHSSILKRILLTLLLSVISTSTVTVYAATSSSFSLNSDEKHAENSASTSFSLCSQIPYAGTGGSSSTFQVMPALNCDEQAVVIPPGGGGGGRRHTPVCGDAILESPEQCDDGNVLSGDGCSSSCQYEVCGDSITQPALGEQCDDGNLNNGDGCSDRCFDENTIIPGGPGPGVDPEPEDPEDPELPSDLCGNSVIDEGEQCDDGNRFRADGCNSRCLLEIPGAPVYSDEVVLQDEEQEEEEPIDLIGDPTIPFYGAALLSVCGNSIRESGETCDDGNTLSGDGCSSICRRESAILPPTIIPESTPFGLGIDYLTNDTTTLFFEQLPGGSGEYEITVSDDEGNFYDLVVVPTNDGFFSFQLSEDLPDGFYSVRVTDLQRPEQSRNLILEVRQFEDIQAPLLVRLGQYDLTEREDFLNLILDTADPILEGQTTLPASIAIYSEYYDRTFVVFTNLENHFFFSYPETLVAGFSDRLSLVAHYENGTVSREEIIEVSYPGELRMSAEEDFLYWCFRVFDPLFWAFMSTLFILLLSVLIYGGKNSRMSQGAVKESLLMMVPSRSLMSRMAKILLGVLILMALVFFTLINVMAATTTPNIVPYEGVLKDAGGTAISTAHDFRFSFWSDSDFTVGVDRDGAGAIPGGAPGNSGFSEEHTVTPDASGFFQMDIGSVGGTIPDFIFTTHLYIQVEIKVNGAADTAYETLDIDGVDNATDRQAIGTLPYAHNSDFIDNRELGESSGDIALLGAGDVFPTKFIPGGTDVDNFIIDADDDAPGNIQLSFGALLNNQILEWDPDGVAAADGWFNFTDDVNIGGDLTITGTVNGVTIGPKNVGYQFAPEYPNTTLHGDGTSNRGKMEVFFIDTDGAAAPDNFNYYRWTTRQTSIQDMDLVARFRLPDDFSSFQAIPLVLRYRTSDNNLANNRLDISVEDSTGTVVPGMLGNTALVSGGAFTTTNITFGGGTFTAGQEITLIIKMSTLDTTFADLSDVTFNMIVQ